MNNENIVLDITKLGVELKSATPDISSYTNNIVSLYPTVYSKRITVCNNKNL